jgi:RND family efflux transporter MFP subunit
MTATSTVRSWARLTLTLTGLAVVLGSGVWSCRRAERSGEHASAAAGATYYCPMHTTYKSDKPGNCPICSMRLVPIEGAAPASSAAPAMSPEGMKPGESALGPASSAPSAGVAQAIRIAPERQQQIGVKFAAAAMAPAQVELRAVGKVAFDETQIAHVHTKVSGWIEDVFVDFVGAPVKKDQPLFSIYSPELVSSQEEYLLALRAKDELGGSSFARVAEGSRSLVASARRRLELWDLTPAQIEALEKEGKVSRTITVVSHVNGVVTERAAYHHGRTVTPEMDLYTIVDLSRVWVQAAVYESEAPFVAVGQAAEITLPYAERKTLRGRVAFISPFVDPATRTVQVRTEFANAELALKPDAFVDVVLRRDLGTRLLVAKDAVLDTGTSQYVFVDKGDGYLEPRAVKAGPEVAAGRVITDGLREGDRVVTAANFILDSESRLKGAIDAMGRPVAAESQPSGSKSSVSVEVTTDPSPAKVGRNHVRALVKDAAGAPIADADVEIRFFMPQMAGMAQVDVRAPLKVQGSGMYAGDVELPIAWSFATTVTVRRAGQVIGTAETTVTSR